MDGLSGLLSIGTGVIAGVNGVVSTLFTGSIQELLALVRSLQVTCHMMLVDLPTPAFVNVFFKKLFLIVSLDLVNTDDLFDTYLRLEPT